MNSDKRLLLFVVGALLIMTAYMGLTIWLAPRIAVMQPKPAPANKKAADKPAVKPNAPAGKAEIGAPSKDPAVAVPPGPVAAAPPVAIPESWTTLGSVDPADGYQMLVTFRGQGAAIERIELASERYRDLEDPTGYLGHLALASDTGGCRVRVVGHGTPAAIAGLKVNDIITRLGDRDVSNEAAVQEALATTKPGDVVEVQVVRTDGQGKKSTLNVSATLGRRPLEIVRPETSRIGGQTVEHPLSLLWSLHSIGSEIADRARGEIGALPSLRDGHWKAQPLPNPQRPGVEFTRTLSAAELQTIGAAGTLSLVKRYYLSPAQPGNELTGYHLEIECDIQNAGAEPVTLAYRLDGPTGLPTEGWWYTIKSSQNWSSAGVRDVAWKAAGGPHQLVSCASILQESAKDDKGYRSLAKEETALGYLGVDSQYFSAVLMPAMGEPAENYIFQRVEAFPPVSVEELNPKKRTLADISFRLISPIHTVAPGESWSQKFVLFAGPKKKELLQSYALDELVQFGWWYWISPRILNILEFFYWLTGNYGVSIVLLTVLVRSCMFPLSLKVVKNAQKMQEIKPEMDKLREKYKSEPQKLWQAQQELMQKNNVNMFAGCLPMFLQLPVFMGLYRALQVDIELRQAPLVPGWEWCSNLAGPDKFFMWQPYLFDYFAGPTGLLGPYFNLLPAITICLFLFNQKMALPPPTDEQTKMQYQVMTVMTVVMGFMFFKVPAGLCLYFIASSTWSMAERQLLPKAKTPAPTGKAAPAK